MRYSLRTLIFRVLAGLLIGIGMFYFRQAHAQTCPTGQQIVYRVAGCGFDNPNANTCPQYGTDLPSKSAVEALLNQLDPVDTLYSPGGNRQSCNETVVSSDTVNFYSLLRRSNPTGHTASCLAYSPFYYVSANPVCAAPPPPTCSADATGFWSYDVSQPSDTACKNQCLYNSDKKRTSTQDGFAPLYIVHYVGAGAVCPTGTPAPASTPAETPPVQTTPAGQFTPNGDNSQNCGTINGAAVCLDKPTGTGKCTRLDSGGGFCVTPAVTPPIADAKPDTGTAGTTATATGTQINQNTASGTNTTSSTTNFYSANTFTNSLNYGRGPTGSGTTTTGTTTGPTPTTTPGTTSCATPPCGDGKGTGNFRGKGGSAKSFGQSATDFNARVAASALLQGVSGISEATPTGGTCPTASFNVLGHQFTIDAQCTLLNQYGTLIHNLFYLFWCLFAVSLFFRA